MRVTRCAALALSFLLSTVPLAAAEAVPATGSPTDTELTSEVPELTAYHGAIARLWHEAWPNKDLETMTALLPDIESGAASIEEAVLPGILRDRLPKWNQGVIELVSRVGSYRRAVGSKDLQASLDAAEQLHAAYEQLVRVVRPALPEIDQFHQTLYKLYHYDLPAWNLDGIRTAASAMRERQARLDEARLPARLEAKRDEFESKRRLLGESVEALNRVVANGSDRGAIEEAVEALHARYVDLEAIF
ncbi:MAG TPA: hypothetical protein VNI57_02785 [Candidatus Saccharimonadales bacterium]|nr:hypothetical protein [Candidatus Saccharimonadales bacterium]